jgi:pyruvate ferredoxin oxidoreductase beta subunit
LKLILKLMQMENHQDTVRELTGPGIKGGCLCRGCGPQIGLKIALQALENVIIVNGRGCMSLLAKYPNTAFPVPYLNPGPNAAAAASGIWHAMKNDEKKQTIIVYAGDSSTAMNLPSIISAAEKSDNILYICYNNKKPVRPDSLQMERGFARSLAPKTKYSATASVAYPEDFIKKLKKAASLEGFKYIEILAPCPQRWKFDHSNTIEIARMAVETGAWPLFEIENRRLSLTRIPLRLEPLELYLDLQGVPYNKEELPSMQEKINRSWKLLNDGRII